MKKLILATIIMVVALSSCITQQKCNERFPLQLTDSIKTVTVFVDAIVHDTVNLQAKEVSIHDTLPCPELNYSKETHLNGLTERIKIIKGVIVAECKEDSLQVIIDSLFKIPVQLTTEIKTETQKEATNILTKWQSFLIVCGYLFWISWILFAAFTAIRIYLKSITGK